MAKSPRKPTNRAGLTGSNTTITKIAKVGLRGNTSCQPDLVKSSKIGPKVPNYNLGSEKRRKIAKDAAEARRSGKESAMSEKQRLLHTLFERPGRELINIKFFRGSNEDISEDRFCSEVNKVLFEIDNELTMASDHFTERAQKKTDVKELVRKLS